MTKDREAGIALAIKACCKLVEVCDEAGICDLCGCNIDEDDHNDDCPCMDAERALQLLGIKE